jgi:hypothetical protein
VLFVFAEEVQDGMFIENTDSGIYLGKSIDSSAKEARWAVAAAVGPDVTQIKAGDKILIGALRWTEGFKADGMKLWKTVEKEILAFDTPEGIKLSPPGDNVFFILDNKAGKVTHTDAGVYVVESAHAGEEMSWGTVKATGPDVDVDDIQPGSRILVKRDLITKFMKNADGDLYKITQADVFAIQESE